MVEVRSCAIAIVLPILLVWMISLEFFVSGHGRLMDPPGRGSIWRFPEFDYLEPPTNYDDDGLYCGGASVQHDQNDGNCGLCGDDYSLAIPRPHEDGGTYGRGILVRNYTVGQVLPIKVELTKSHGGYFEFSLCQRDNSPEGENDECFEQNLLQLADGSGSKIPVDRHRGGFYESELLLPSNLTCERCVIRWHYRVANSEGDCGDGTFEIGCGAQETFRSCADISIT